MSFLSTFMGAYGIGGNDGGEPKKEAAVDECAGTTDAACVAKLMGKEGGPGDDEDERAFLREHVDLLRRSRRDAAESNIQAFLAAVRRLPKWLWIVLVVLAVITFLICIIPALVIGYTLLRYDHIALFKVVMMGCFAFCLVICYVLVEYL
jgi:hypothetical protein